jgi:hypothetical protein
LIFLLQLQAFAVGKFEIGAHLQRIDEYTFAGSALKEIVIPASVDALTLSCFHDCNAFSPMLSLGGLDFSAITGNRLSSGSLTGRLEDLCESLL